MKFGIIKSYMLLGGGRLFFKIAIQLKERKIPFSAVTSIRHLNEKINEMSLKECLENNGIEFMIKDEINDDQEVIDKINLNTMGICIAAPWILKKSFIDRFEGRLVNVHGTRLPQNRGGGGYTWQILNSNRLGICLIHQFEEGLDVGPIVKYKEFLYPIQCRIPNDYMLLHNKKYENWDEFTIPVLKATKLEPTAEPAESAFGQRQ